MLWKSIHLGQIYSEAWQKSADELVSHVSGDMGETHELAGSRHSLRHVLSEPTINGIQFACTDMLPAYLKKQTVKLRELLKFNLRSVKAHLMRIQGPVFRYCGGLQQQSQIDHEKSLWLQDV
jgi:hypothetical protein